MKNIYQTQNKNSLFKYLFQLSFKFSMISTTETWCSDDSFFGNSNFYLHDYNVLYYEQ